jgi:hypothetical protein
MDRTKTQSGLSPSVLLAELALSRDEDTALTDALTTADANSDGLVDEWEWSDFQTTTEAQTLFDDLYDGESANGLRHKIFSEIGTLLAGGILEFVSVEKRLAALDGAERALTEQVTNFETDVPLSKLIREHSSYWTQYQRFKTRFEDTLILAHQMEDSGDFETIPRQLDVAAAELRGAQTLWQGYLRDVATVFGHAANVSGDVVAGAAAIEAVLGTGGLALGELVPVAAAGTLSVGLHTGIATSFLPDYAAEDTSVPSATPPLEEIPVSAAETAEITEDAPPAEDIRLRTADELAAEAKARLVEFGKTGAVGGDMGRFLLEANLAADYDKNAPYFPDILKEFDARRTAHFQAAQQAWGFTDASSFREKIDALRKRFYMDGSFTAYRKGQAQLSDGLTLDGLLNGDMAGGNCDFRNQALISYMTDPRFPQSADWTPGVQFLPFHVQPVLYNAKENQVWDLSSGAIVTGVAGPVYHPAIMLWSYAQGRAQIEASPDDNLVIAKPDGAAATEKEGESSAASGDSIDVVTGIIGVGLGLPALIALGTNTVFHYPTAGMSSSGGVPNIPDFAFETYSDSQEVGPVGTQSESVESSGGKSGWASLFTKSFSDNERELQVKTFGEVAARAGAGDKTFDVSWDSQFVRFVKSSELFTSLLTTNLDDNDRYLVFKNPDHARTFANLSDPQEKDDFLKYLTDLSLRAQMGTPDIKDLLRFIKDPQSFATAGSARLRAMRSSLYEPFTTYSRMEYHRSDLSHTDVFEGRFESWPTAMEFPALMEFKETSAALTRQIAADPGLFIAFINGLPEPSRFEYLELILTISDYAHASGIDLDASLMAWIKDPAKVKIDNQGQTPPPSGGWPRPRVPKINLPESASLQPITIQILDDADEGAPRAGKSTKNDAETAVDESMPALPNAQPNPFIDAHPSRRKTQGAATTEPDAPIVISPQTYLDFLHIADVYSRHNSDSLLKRWTPALSAAVRKLNATGQYDFALGGLFEPLMNSRSAQIVPAEYRDKELSYIGQDPADASGKTAVFQYKEDINSTSYRLTPVRATVPPDLFALYSDLIPRHHWVWDQTASEEDLSPRVIEINPNEYIGWL